VTGRLFEAGAGFVSEVRWQRAKGEVLDRPALSNRFCEENGCTKP
jgi:hypothetical protein